MVGDECTAARDMLEMSYPITNGVVQKWDDMIHLCARASHTHHTRPPHAIPRPLLTRRSPSPSYNYTFFDRLKIDPTEHKIMLTEAAMNPQKNREALVETMFETYR